MHGKRLLHAGTASCAHANVSLRPQHGTPVVGDRRQNSVKLAQQSPAPAPRPGGRLRFLHSAAGAQHRGIDGVRQQHGDRHRAQSAGDGRDEACALGGPVKLDIADDLSSGAEIDPDIKHGRSGRIHSPGTNAFLADAADDQDFGPFDLGPQIARQDVAYRYRGTARAAARAPSDGRRCWRHRPPSRATPESSMPYSRARRITPKGVHGRRRGRFCASRPVLSG